MDSTNIVGSRYGTLQTSDMAFRAIRGCEYQLSRDTNHETIGNEYGCLAKWYHGKGESSAARDSRKVNFSFKFLIQNLKISPSFIIHINNFRQY